MAKKKPIDVEKVIRKAKKWAKKTVEASKGMRDQLEAEGRRSWCGHV